MRLPRWIIVPVFLAALGCGSGSPLVTRARIAIQDLDKAVATYRVQNDRWPDDLDDLTQPATVGGEGYVPSDRLTDPWGRPYHYDASERHPSTGQPLIWSDGPDPGMPGSRIANWEVHETSHEP